MKSIYALLLLLPMFAQANVSYHFGGWSKHFSSGYDVEVIHKYEQPVGYVFGDSFYLEGWATVEQIYAERVAYNESHKFHAIEYNNIIAGTLVNSYNKRGYFAGYNLKKDWGKYLQYGVVIAGTTGYTEKVRPSALPYVGTKGLLVNAQVSFFGDGVLLTLRLDF